jgi:hypothetical protein
MKRTFLFIGYESSMYDEIADFIHERDGDVFFSDSIEQSIHVLDEAPIDTVILTLHKLGDAAILKYINQYYPDVKVLISASKEYDDIIHVFNIGKFSLLREPLKLKELNTFI